MTETEQRALVDRYISAYNDFDVEGMLAVLHAEVQFRNVAGGVVNASATGVEAFRRMAEQATELFTSRHQEVTGFRSGPSTAEVDILYEGLLASSLPNGMKAGETLRLTGKSEFGFREGKIDQITDIS